MGRMGRMGRLCRPSRPDRVKVFAGRSSRAHAAQAAEAAQAPLGPSGAPKPPRPPRPRKPPKTPGRPPLQPTRYACVSSGMAPLGTEAWEGAAPRPRSRQTPPQTWRWRRSGGLARPRHDTLASHKAHSSGALLSREERSLLSSKTGRLHPSNAASQPRCPLPGRRKAAQKMLEIAPVQECRAGQRNPKSTGWSRRAPYNGY